MKPENAEYETKKFTLPAKLAERLDKLADEHSNENTSRFLRNAIKDHARTLDGQDEFEFKNLQHEVERIAARVDELMEAVENDSREQSFRTVPESIQSTAPEKSNTSDVAIQRRVHKCLVKTNDEAVGLHELANQVDAEPLAIQTAVESLLEKEYVEKESDSKPVRYRICPP